MPKKKISDETLIEVCDVCLRACCWHGEFMCDDSREAGTIKLPAGFLRSIEKHLNHTGSSEHEDYWREYQKEGTL